MHWLRRAFVGAAAAAPMALLLAPVAAARPQASSLGYGYAFVMYAASSLICHQRPERSFYLLGAQLPVCARCMGIYAGAAVAACVLLMRTAKAVRYEADSVGATDLSRAGSVAKEGAGAWSGAQDPGRRVPVAQDFSPAPRTILLASALPTAATLIIEWTTGHTPGNWTRAVSGVPLGAAVAWIVGGLR